MPKLIVASGMSKGSEYLIHGSVILGRSEDANIVIADRRASREHAKIEIGPHGLLIEDLGSRNGTYVNGKPISRVLLNNGDEIRICDTVFKTELEAAPQSQANRVSGVRNTMMGGVDLGSSMVSITQEGGPAPALNVSMAADIGEMMRQSAAGDQAVEAANKRLKVMLKVANAISTLHEPQELSDEIMNQLKGIFPQMEQGAVMIKAVGSDDLEPIAVRGAGESVEIKLSQAVISEVMGKQNVVLSQDTASDDRFSERMSIMNLQIRSMMSVPLICRGELLGLIYLDTQSRTQAFNEDDLGLLNCIAPQVAIAIKNASLLSEVKRETERRASLARYLSPDLVDQIITGDMSLDVGGELAHGTVFMSDILGFTNMAEKVSPQQVVAKLNRYFHVMENIIFKHLGTIDKFQGDAIMAFWGVLAPIEHADLQAVQAALEMQNALFAFNAELAAERQDEIWMGIGLNTGDFVAGNIGSDRKIEFTVIGDDVNVAARIEAFAGRYTVLISESTFSKIRPHVSVVKFPPTEVKGKSLPIGIYAVRGALPSADADLDSGMIANMMATLAYRGQPKPQVVHIVWGRNADDGSIVLDVLSHRAFPAPETQVTLAPALQEKPSLAPVSARIVTSGQDLSDDENPSAVPVYRARMTVSDPSVALIELLSPGSILNSDMSLKEMGRR